MVEAAGSIHEAGLNAGVSPGSCISSVLAWWRWLDIVLAVQPESGQVPGRGVRVRHPDCTAQAAADCVSGASCSASCFVVTPGVR